ncbi:CobW family GTP-binding protein [Paenibacillus whitsoniae]|uniref:GTP-binding protein n=1 Tax=Paenibacillus whitsoniae TaxID=2496558 RepID=A0A430JGK7_9BACL|nr:GTP-binding protein [Paenibacillus whitsoniae]RTE10167.1 GTP-binding protein [Paenibacillus whitsoniae]
METIPVFVLSGFLGSGKTTLLTNMLAYFLQQNKKPAVIMNEIGDVNLDGMLVDDDVPMAEMLNGCICCTIREDLSKSLLSIVRTEKPDVIIIESTGIANPLELIEGITNTSLIVGIDLRLVITVVSAPHFLDASRGTKGKTVRLMEEQIRCADLILLNKIDLIEQKDFNEINNCLQELNPKARVEETIRCNLEINTLIQMTSKTNTQTPAPEEEIKKNKQFHVLSNHGKHHHTHNHVMVYTHYFDHPIDHEKFEKLFGQLPKEVYRAKGILQFTKSEDRFLFQYAYREMEIVKLDKQQEVQNVAVFIGEHFDKEQVDKAIRELTILEGR